MTGITGIVLGVSRGRSSNIKWGKRGVKRGVKREVKRGVNGYYMTRPGFLKPVPGVVVTGIT